MARDADPDRPCIDDVDAAQEEIKIAAATTANRLRHFIPEPRCSISSQAYSAPKRWIGLSYRILRFCIADKSLR